MRTKGRRLAASSAEEGLVKVSSSRTEFAASGASALPMASLAIFVFGPTLQQNAELFELVKAPPATDQLGDVVHLTD